MTARHNSPLTLWDGARFLNRCPKKYILLVLLLPSLLAALAAAALAGPLTGAAALMAAFAVMWILQYFCFQ
jgi:hypothetical protein